MGIEQTRPHQDAAYWKERYQLDQTGWDLGAPNMGLLQEAVQLIDQDARILIPGAGRAYEAIWLWEQGYVNTYVCDWALEAFQGLARQPSLPNADRLIVADFFGLTAEFDLILEQTFFCAIDPSMREAYAKKTASLLAEGGYLLGVLFDRYFPLEGPPFGGNREEYQKLFGSFFDLLQLIPFSGSVGPRAGTELLLIARKTKV